MVVVGGRLSSPTLNRVKKEETIEILKIISLLTFHLILHFIITLLIISLLIKMTEENIGQKN